MNIKNNKQIAKLVDKRFSKFTAPIDKEWRIFLYTLLLSFSINILSAPRDNIVLWLTCILILIFSVVILIMYGKAYNATEANIQKTIDLKMGKGEINQPGDIDQCRINEYETEGPWLALKFTAVVLLVVVAASIFGYLITIKRESVSDQSIDQSKHYGLIEEITTDISNIKGNLRSVEETLMSINNEMQNITAKTPYYFYKKKERVVEHAQETSMQTLDIENGKKKVTK